MKKIHITTAIAAICIGAILSGGCRSKQTISPSYATFSFETTYMGQGNDGSVVLRAWGKGPSIDKAIEQAKKNAVSDVIFKGVGTTNAYNQQPLVTEVNARERYADYFDRFFADGGEYANFIKESSNKDGSRVESKGNSRENYGVVVEVNRSALKRQLINDGILRR